MKMSPTHTHLREMTHLSVNGKAYQACSSVIGLQVANRVTAIVDLRQHQNMKIVQRLIDDPNGKKRLQGKGIRGRSVHVIDLNCIYAIKSRDEVLQQSSTAMIECDCTLWLFIMVHSRRGYLCLHRSPSVHSERGYLTGHLDLSFLV